MLLVASRTWPRCPSKERIRNKTIQMKSATEIMVQGCQRRDVDRRQANLQIRKWRKTIVKNLRKLPKRLVAETMWTPANRDNDRKRSYTYNLSNHATIWLQLPYDVSNWMKIMQNFQNHSLIYSAVRNVPTNHSMSVWRASDAFDSLQTTHLRSD